MSFRITDVKSMRMVKMKGKELKLMLMWFRLWLKYQRKWYKICSIYFNNNGLNYFSGTRKLYANSRILGSKENNSWLKLFC